MISWNRKDLNGSTHGTVWNGAAFFIAMDVCMQVLMSGGEVCVDCIDVLMCECVLMFVSKVRDLIKHCGAW